MKKVLFIGLGHMGTSLLSAILPNAKKLNIDVYGFNRSQTNLAKIKAKFANFKALKTLKESEELNIDIIVIGVRPSDFANLALELKQFNLKQTTIVSMINALEIKTISTALADNNVEIVRIMPNINAEIKLSVTGMSFTNKPKELELLTKMFAECGSVTIIPETQLGSFTAIAGCLPAYVFSFFKAATEFAINAGFAQKQAYQIIAQTMIGSIKNCANNDMGLSTMIDQICVPNGATIAGKKVLDENNFEEILKKCLKVAERKAI